MSECVHFSNLRYAKCVVSCAQFRHLRGGDASVNKFAIARRPKKKLFNLSVSKFESRRFCVPNNNFS